MVWKSRTKFQQEITNTDLIIYLMNRSIVGGIMLCLLSAIACAQQNGQDTKYRMKSLPIATRWAKDVNPKNALPEYPRPQMVRSNWTNLNGLWDYAIVKPGEQMPSQFQGKILVPFPVESSLSGVRKKLDPPNLNNHMPLPQNELWYKRRFSAPILKAGEKLLLNFGAVSWQATVYVNRKEAGYHTGSYTAFTVDLTDYINTGENLLSIKIANPLENGIGPRGKQTLSPGQIWYTPSSGIWQTVWLEKVPATYITSIKITPDVDHSQVHITVYATGTSHVSIKAAGKTVNGKSNSEIVVPVSNARLWSPDDPYLYDVKIRMGTDVVKSYFGLRKVEIQKDDKGIDRIYLNNKYTYNLGTLDQGFWPDGLYTAPTDAALKFDIQAIKAMGFNTIRKHIKVKPARWYYHADKLGMLVWQDLVQPASKFGQPPTDEAKKEFEKESAEILDQLRNHPSITAWVLFNEHWGEYHQDRLTKWVKSTDATRLVNGHSGSVIVSGKVNEGAMVEVMQRSQNSEMTDIHSYPSPAMAFQVPGKANVLGEFGGIGVQVAGHLFDDVLQGWGYGETVSAGTMRKQYGTMVDSLILLEKRGLSASIYTQPFDVETEQNGLMTYDREVIKMPVEDIRRMHAELWPTTANYAIATKSFRAKIADTAKKDYAAALKEYKAGKKDSASLRALALLAASARDSASKGGRIFANEYIRQVKDPLAEMNLAFICRFTKTTKDEGFDIIFKNKQCVEQTLGSNKTRDIIKGAIFYGEINAYVSNIDKNPDWGELKKKVVARYGNYGEDMLLQAKAYHHINRKEWDEFAIAASALIDKYGEYASSDLLNTFAWTVFENISDNAMLQSALSWSRTSLLGDSTNHFCLDTYANLLYKLGRKDEAIEWEEKAIAIGALDEYKDALDKMKAGKPSWPTAGNQNN